MHDQEHSEPERAAQRPGTTRRGMLRGAAGLGAAGLAAGMLTDALVSSSAQAATKDNQAADAGSAAHDEPLVVHINDARTGVVDLYTGTSHVRFTDHALAARLARATN